MRASLLLILSVALVASSCLNKTTKTNRGGSLTAPPPDPEFLRQPPPESRLKLGNRSQISSILVDVFGPSIKPITDAMVLNSGFHFGGACDTYAGDCATGAGTLPNPIPLPISSREALISRACDRIAATDAAIDFAGSQALAGGDPRTIVPGRVQIDRAYDLLFPGKPAPEPIALELARVIQVSQSAGDPPIESWRFLFLGICLLPEWQIL